MPNSEWCNKRGVYIHEIRKVISMFYMQFSCTDYSDLPKSILAWPRLKTLRDINFKIRLQIDL